MYWMLQYRKCLLLKNVLPLALLRYRLYFNRFFSNIICLRLNLILNLKRIIQNESLLQCFWLISDRHTPQKQWGYCSFGEAILIGFFYPFHQDRPINITTLVTLNGKNERNQSDLNILADDCLWPKRTMFFLSYFWINFR
jgi:hypothetical protein